MSFFRICLIFRKSCISIFLFVVCVTTWLVIEELDKHIVVKQNLAQVVPQTILDFANNFPDPSVQRLQDERYGQTCSEEASQLGFHQKVISYSFYKSDDGYWIGLNNILWSIGRLYPDWYVRIYAKEEDIIFLKSKLSRFSYLFYCDIRHVPAPLNSLENYPATTWRFAPLGDPQVDVAIIRDTDSQIVKREVDAVTEWLSNTTKSLHIMRDSESHNITILAGMFGVRMTHRNRMKVRDARDTMYEKAFKFTRFNHDQPVLKQVLWRAFRTDVMMHDSHYCLRFPGSSPWPTKRNRRNHFVGSAFYRNKDKNVTIPCPVRCRPKKHKDWVYC